MYRRIVATLATTSLLAVGSAALPVIDGGPIAVAQAKSCSSGYKRAQISGQTKCLRRGQFCARAADSQYRRYGYRCTKYDAKVRRYRLT